MDHIRVPMKGPAPFEGNIQRSTLSLCHSILKSQVKFQIRCVIKYQNFEGIDLSPWAHQHEKNSETTSDPVSSSDPRISSRLVQCKSLAHEAVRCYGDFFSFLPSVVQSAPLCPLLYPASLCVRQPSWRGYKYGITGYKYAIRAINTA